VPGVLTPAQLALVPSLVTRQAGAGDSIGWNFAGLPADTTSAAMIIHTNATQWQPVVNGVIDAGAAVVDSFGPTPIPEPATAAAIGALALAGLSVAPRRRR
jgi:hypothetical protein